MKHHHITVSVVAGLCLLSAASLVKADVRVFATLCNRTSKPVEFDLYNHNDMLAGVAPLVKKAVQPCSCVEKETHTDLWHNFPPAHIYQLVYRDVEGTSGTNIKVCVDVKGKFEGYIDAKASTCVESKDTAKYLAAPELTRAKGDLKVLESRLLGKETKRDKSQGRTYWVTYEYKDGAVCQGNM